MRKTILLCSGALLTMNLLQWWLFFYSPWTIPEYFIPFPDFPAINLHGLAILVTVTTVLWFFLKRCLRDESEASIAELTSIGTLAEFFAEAVFQLIRQFSYPDSSPTQHIYNYFTNVFAMSFFGGIISLSMAGRLRKNRVIPWITTAFWVLLGCGYLFLHSAGLI